MFVTHIAATNEINILDMCKYSRNTHTSWWLERNVPGNYDEQLNFLF